MDKDLQQAFKEAEERIRSDFAEMVAELRKQGASDTEVLQELMCYVRSNRSHWSGGAASFTNVHESLMREVALEHMDRIITHMR